MIIFVLAHLFGDFVFQKDSDVAKKNISTLKGNLNHILKISLLYIVAAILYILLANNFDTPIFINVIIFVIINVYTHLLIDLGKTWLSKRKNYHRLKALLLDQLCHIAILFITFKWLLVDIVSQSDVYHIYLPMILFATIATFVSSVIIREVLDLFNLEKEDQQLSEDKLDDSNLLEDSLPTIEIGKWIGIIERTIMFLSLYFNLFGLLTIVVAFKTLSRYDKFKSNPEYYIIGNLLSILFVLISYGLYMLIL